MFSLFYSIYGYLEIPNHVFNYSHDYLQMLCEHESTINFNTRKRKKTMQEQGRAGGIELRPPALQDNTPPPHYHGS